MNALAEILQETIREKMKPGEIDVALLFSGGVDSLSVGFAAEAIGLRVHAYTFRVAEIETADSQAARACAIALKWPLTIIDAKPENLPKDFIELSDRWKCKKKTQFECTWPFLYLVPEIRERLVLSGIAADGHFGLSKKAMIHYRRPREKFDTFRRSYFGSPNPAGQLQQKALLEAFGHEQIAPYLDPRVFNFFIGFDWDQINNPVQKQITLSAYPERFAIVRIRKHANLQIVAGVEDYFRELLKNPDLNKKNRSRVLDLCADWGGNHSL